MSAEKIQRAVERLRVVDILMYTTAIDQQPVSLEVPLAKLIEAAADHGDCYICKGDNKRKINFMVEEILPEIQHAPDCALMALVRAVLGEGG